MSEPQPFDREAIDHCNRLITHEQYGCRGLDYRTALRRAWAKHPAAFEKCREDFDEEDLLEDEDEEEEPISNPFAK